MEKDFSFGVIPYYIKDGELLFLLIQHQAGHWSFPKGHREGNESDYEVAIRELREETGLIQVELDEHEVFREHYSWNLDGRTLDKTVTYFLGKVRDDAVTIRPQEVQAYTWLNYQAALQRITFPEAKTVLGQAYLYLLAQINQSKTIR